MQWRDPLIHAKIWIATFQFFTGFCLSIRSYWKKCKIQIKLIHRQCDTTLEHWRIVFFFNLWHWLQRHWTCSRYVQVQDIFNCWFRFFFNFLKYNKHSESIAKAKQVPYRFQQIFKRRNSYKHRSKGPKSGSWCVLFRYKFIQKIQVIIL